MKRQCQSGRPRNGRPRPRNGHPRPFRACRAPKVDFRGVPKVDTSPSIRRRFIDVTPMESSKVAYYTPMPRLWFLTGKATAGDCEGQEHVAQDQVMIVSPMLWRYTELTYTEHMISILYTVYSIMTVSLNLAIIYAMALR